MKIKLNKLKEIHDTLSIYSNEKLPIKLSYKIMKLLSAIEKEVSFFQEKLNSLIMDCADKDEEGNIIYTDNGENIQLQKDKIEQFNSEYQELTEMEVEIEDFSFTLDELDALKISPKELYTLSDFIIEE